MKPNPLLDKAKMVVAALLVFPIGYILHLNLIIPAFLLVLYAYYKATGRNDSGRHGTILQMTFLFVIIFTASYYIIQHRVSAYWIPFSAIPMLCMALFNDLSLSLLATLASGVCAAAVSGGNFYLAALFLISGLLSSMLVQSARRRASIIRAGFIIGMVQAVVLVFIEYFRITDINNYAILIVNGMYSSIIVVGILPVFEYLFGTVTNVSLLELADFHHPLLQRMIMEAPGTYHHSLVVGNLSEAACDAVGANALLARIGAYYHDIGKLSKPEYFSENQYMIANKHDDLSPSMSKMVIMNHVRDGLELAKKYKLNASLYEFILQHHGTSLVYYFYRRALENLEGAQDVPQEGFRYPGPKPDRKETAIVLLADSVEAATRTLKEPAPADIEEMVRKIINNKFIDGQLDECDLTLKDLEKIAAVFIRILGGIYHSRVVYPHAESSENNHTKPSKQDTHQRTDNAPDKKRDS
ncbi:MAG TPA: HDIG domain-containing protein [Patescibacteria group bacterium]|nr:HDIG domain-containing protein [Patescibacteria group bacterium]